MVERLDRALALLERLVVAVERIATAPSGRLPEPRRAQRRAARVREPADPVDELAAERARRALERRGLR